MPASIASSHHTAGTAPSTRSRPTVGAAATTADNIATRRISQARRTINASQLDALATQFDAFAVDLQEDTTKIHETEEDRLVGIERWVQRIERSLVTEQAQRVDMFSLVQNNLQQQCDALMHRTRAQLEELRPTIPQRIAAWHERLQEDEDALDEELIRTRMLIEREYQRNKKTIEDFEAALEVEKVERLEREAITIKKIVDENIGVGQLVDEERARREATLGHLRDDNDITDQLRDKPDQIFKEDMMARMVRSIKDIKLETSRRVTAERQFVDSLECYTKALQGGLHLVNSKPIPERPRASKVDLEY